MKSFHKIFSAFLLTAVMIQFFALPVMASQMEHEGLEVTIQMDKEIYEEGEPITATITVKNTNAEAVTVTNLEQLIPEGYNLAEDSEVNTADFVLEPGQSVILKVTYGEIIEATEENATANFVDTVIYGETLGIPNVLIAFLAVVGIIVFFKLT